MVDVRWKKKVLPQPFEMALLCDVHGHFRWDEVITDIAVEHAVEPCDINAAEPNIKDDPILTTEQALNYQAYLLDKAASKGRPDHRFLMILQLTPQTTAEELWLAYRNGVRIVKYYPEGVTTNSDNGIRDWRQCYEAIATMAEICRLHPDEPMVFQIHAEAPDEPDRHKRERRFLKVVKRIATLFPTLIISLAHASTWSAIYLARKFKNIGVEITVHHMLLTWSDVLQVDPDHDHKTHMNGHCYCAPVVKTERDRRALVRAAMGYYPELAGRVYLGSDFAPHHLMFKEGQEYAYPDGKLPNTGVYSLDVMLSLLVSIFRKEGGRYWLQRLQKFACWNGAKWFGVAPPRGRMRVTYNPRVVPDHYGNPPALRSFMAGKTVEYQAERLAA